MTSIVQHKCQKNGPPVRAVQYGRTFHTFHEEEIAELFSLKT